MIEYLAGIVRGTLAIAAAMLPRRYWGRWEPPLPVANAALGASLITLLAGAALGVTGFLAHLQDTAALNNELYLQAAMQAAREGRESLPMPSGLNVLALFTFVLLTPQGWISSYLVTSGALRSAGALYDDAHGDFMLTLADFAVRTAARKAAARAEIDNRHLLEGPRVRDRIVRGAQLGLPDAELVVVSSRVKEGWTPGTVVLTDRGAFRIVAVEDRTIDGQLRRLYSLAGHRDLEVFRRTVHYEFP